MATSSTRPPPKGIPFSEMTPSGLPAVTNAWYDWAMNIRNAIDTILTRVTVIEDDLDDPAGELQRLLKADVAVFAPQMLPTITGGCDALLAIEFDPAKPNLVALPFQPNVDTSADFHEMLPFSWAGKTFSIWIYWGHGGSGTAWDVAWEVTSNATFDDESLVLDFLPGVLVTDTGGTPGNLYIARLSSIPIASYGNEEGSLVSLRITRRGTYTEDTMDIPAYLLAVRFVLEDTTIPAAPVDADFASVTLLVQGGTDGGTTIQDLSSYGDSVAITSGAAFDNDHQVFSANPIRATVRSADIAVFSSTGLNGRFTRPSGEDCTIEVYAYYTSLDNTTANWLFLWDTGIGGRLCELGFGTSGGALRFRVGDTTEVFTSNLAANTLHYIQLTFIGDTYYLDAGEVPGDGTTTQLATGTAPISNISSATNFRVCRHFTNDATASTGGLWASPIRVTKGVARARGSVPTAAFPTSGP